MPISRPRSGAEIAGIPRGSSEKQIFGNCLLPENRANQILARLLLESRLALFATRRTALASVAGMVTLWRIALDVAERGSVLVLLGILPCETILHLCGADWVKCGVGRRTQRVPRPPPRGAGALAVHPFSFESAIWGRGPA